MPWVRVPSLAPPPTTHGEFGDARALLGSAEPLATDVRGTASLGVERLHSVLSDTPFIPMGLALALAPASRGEQWSHARSGRPPAGEDGGCLLQHSGARHRLKPVLFGRFDSQRSSA